MDGLRSVSLLKEARVGTKNTEVDSGNEVIGCEGCGSSASADMPWSSWPDGTANSRSIISGELELGKSLGMILFVPYPEGS